MRVEGSGTVAASRNRVWALLADPRQVAACVPGVADIEVVDATHFVITKVRVSKIGAGVSVDVEQAELREPEHMTLLAQGRAPGLSARAAADIDLRDGRVAGTTVLAWSIDVEVSGPLAGAGTRLINRSARSVIRRTLGRMNALLGEAPSAAAAALTPTRASVTRFNPTWCLFWGRGVSTAQLDIWMPYIRRSRHRFAIMTPGSIPPADRERIAALPNAMCVEPYQDGVEWLRGCSGFRGYLYVSSKRENLNVVHRHPNHAHVFIGHGESGKGSSGSRTASLYDSLLVSEYSAVRRSPRAIRPWVWRGALAIGTPVVEGVRRDAGTRPRQVRTILYAPTWEGHLEDYTSLDVVAPVLRQLMPELAARGIEVILRPHPATGGRLLEMRGMIEELHAAGAVSGVSKIDAFERADVLIGDISGVTAEFLLTEKPSIMPITPKLADLGRDAKWLDVEYPWVYRWDTTADGLMTLLGEIEARDPLRSRRAAAARKKFRHHRSIDDAVRTFDLALDVLQWRTRPIPLRLPFELRLLAARLRRGRPRSRRPL